MTIITKEKYIIIDIIRYRELREFGTKIIRATKIIELRNILY